MNPLRRAVEPTERPNLFDLPDTVVERLLAGEHPIKVIREHRGLTLEELASILRVEPPLLVEIEADVLSCPENVRIDAAHALNVDERSLIPLVVLDSISK